MSPAAVKHPAVLQSQPLDIFASEVNAQRENLPHFSRGQSPRQGARVWTPVIQDFGNLRHKWVRVSFCEVGNSVEIIHPRLDILSVEINN